MSTKTITVVSVKILGGQGKTSEVSYSIGENTGKAKAWTSDVQGKEGQQLSVEFEKKQNEYQGRTTEEVWIKVPKQGNRGGFGGPGKADPAKLENERKKLELDAVKHQDFLRKWDKDREGEAERQASIASQVILKCAVELSIADQDYDPNNIAKRAEDLANILQDVHAQIFDANKARSAGGGGQ